MLKFILLIVLQGISGGISGYITNKYAVDMLFKEYTPLKLGGVVKKKREKFIEEISELVERDIINSETLGAEISNKNFNPYIEQISEFFFEKGLKDNLSDLKVCEIFDFSNSVTKSEEFINKNLEAILPEFLDNVFTQISLEDILTEDQVSKIVTLSYELLVDEVEKNSVLNNFINDVYIENSNITLIEVFSEEIRKKLIENITENVVKIVNENIINNEKSCQVFLDKIFEVINIDDILMKLQSTIEDCQINKFITDSEEKEIALNIYNKLDEFIKSPKGKELVLSFAKELLYIGKDIDFTIYEMLPTEMEASLTQLIKTVIPKIMPYISDWVSGNKAAFDGMIEEAIDEAIDGMDENIKKLIISKVRSALMGDISSKNDIVNKIIGYFNDNLDDDSYSKLSKNIIDYLTHTKIKSIIKLLEGQELFTVEKVADYIIKQFDLYGKSILESIIRAQFSKKISKFVKLDLANLFNSKLKPALYRSIFNNKNIISKKFNNVIEDVINIKGRELFNKNLSQLFTDTKVSDLSNKFEKLTSSLLKSNREIYKEKINKFIISEIKDADLISMLEKHRADISKFIVDNLTALYKQSVDKNKNLEVKDLICTYFNKEQLSDILINKGYPELISKLPDLLDGNIKKIAKNNLSKYNEDEICDILQEFMGNQLKPLSVFGGILGTVVGIIYQLVFPNSIGWYGFPGSVLNLIMSLSIMAGIGYITNVIALWMIFHPYKENKIVSKIPFFRKFALGYIPAHKQQFAFGMAKLIDEELLNKEELNKSFNEHKGNATSILMSLVTNNNYQILVDYVTNKKESLSRFIYKEILKFCNNENGLGKRISVRIEGSKFKTFIKKEHVLNIIPKLISSISNLQGYLAHIAQSKLSSNYRVSDILPEEISYEIKSYIQAEVQKSISEKIINNKMEFMNIIIDNYKNDYDLLIKKSCKDIFDEEFLSNIKNVFEIKAYSYIANNLKGYIDNYIKQFLNSGLNENNDIGSMFNGKVKEIIDKKIYILTTVITDKAVLYLQNNKDAFTFVVQETIKDNLNFFEKIAYGTFGGDDIANKVVEIILYKKLPIMIQGEIGKIMNIVKFTLDNNIYPVKISSLKIKADSISTVALIDNIFEQFNNKIDLKEYINKFSSMLLEYLISIPLTEYFELCNLHNLELVNKKFYDEINIVKDSIYSSLRTNEIELSKIIGQFLDKEIIVPLFNLYNSQVFNGITAKDIEDVVKNSLNLVISSKAAEKHLTLFGEDLYNNILSEISINQIIDHDILDKDIEKIVKLIFENETFKETNINLIEKIVQNVTENSFDFITDNSKNYLIGRIIETGLISISEYIVPILQEIDLKNIANEQIDALDPREIDILFNSFAGDFFSKLRFYGIFGFVFGINVGLSIILLGFDLRYSNVSSKKDLTHYR
jgi:uncharacterized membrane protein YheB (UPF0754 family)